MNSKIICQCGSTINHNYFRIHIYSKKHIDFISTNPIKDYAECYNEELFYNLNEKMNELTRTARYVTWFHPQQNKSKTNLPSCASQTH